MKNTRKLAAGLTIAAMTMGMMIGTTVMAHAEEFPTMEISLAHVNPMTEDDQYQKFATLFTEKVTERTNGAVTFSIHGNAELGGEADVLTGFDLGTQEMAIVTNGYYAQVYGPSKVIELPFLFEDAKAAHDYLDSDVVKGLAEQLYNDKGYKILGWGEGGFRNICSQKPISTPEDVKGMKIRVPEWDMFMSTFQQLGANPTPMAFSEVFTAVQQGVIDGLEIPVASIYTGSYYEACDYVNLTGHFYNAITMSCSKMFWEGLSPELQEIFTQAAIEAGQEEREWLAGKEEDMLADMEAAGCTVNRDVDQAAFAEAAAPVYEEYRDVIGSDLLDATLEFLGK